jgi:ABC-type branched-subunit amino acid transport system substrate-binding protein
MRRLALLFAVVSAIAGCRGATIPSGATDPIRIGVVLPQTGGLAADGQSWVRGVRLAADEVNAAGGVLGGRRVELLVVDSATEGNAGVTGAQHVLGMGAVAIVGDGGSGNTLSIYTMVTEMAQVPQISGSATSTQLTTTAAAMPASQRYFFRTAPPDGYQAQVVDRIATSTITPACQRLAILYQNDAYGMPLAQGIMTHFSGHGMVVAMEAFMPAQADYGTQVAAVATATPDCVALIAYPQDAGVILRSWEMLPATMRPSVHWIGTDGLDSQDFITQAAMSPLLDGFVGASPLTTPMTPEFNAFAARYHAAYGHDPENFVANYYDATALLLLAIERAGSTTGSDMRDALRAIGGGSGTVLAYAGALREALAAMEGSTSLLNYQGASGPITFDPNGDTIAPYEIWQISGSPLALSQLAVVQASDLMTLP